MSVPPADHSPGYENVLYQMTYLNLWKREWCESLGSIRQDVQDLLVLCKRTVHVLKIDGLPCLKL